MLNPQLSWILSVSMLSLFWLILTIRRGPHLAIGVAIVLSFLMPVWITMSIMGQELSCRTAVAVVAVIGFCVYKKARVWTPITLLDLCITIVFTLDVIADVMVDGLSPTNPFKLYGQWVLPYVSGRCAMNKSDVLRELAPWVISVLTILSFCGLIESASGINPFEVIFGDRPVDGFGRNAQRFGFKRAFGNTMHPMFFGILLLMLIPWCWVPLRSSRRLTKESYRQSPKESSSQWSTQAIGVAVFLTAVGGIGSTVSRGPVFALAIALAAMATMKVRQLRWPVAITSVTLIAIFAVFPTQFLDFLGRAVDDEDRRTLVEVDGQAVEFSGTQSRLLIFHAYGDALRHAGLTGYGSRRTTGFPPNIPYLQTTRHTVERLRNVDNAYVLFTLRFGYLGVASFILLVFAALLTAAKLSNLSDLNTLFAAICGSFAGLAAVLLSVWFSYDFGFTVLWTMGILSGLASAGTSADSGSTPIKHY